MTATATEHLHFYDAANPANIASGHAAAFYVNGFTWSQAEIDRMSRVFGVSVLQSSIWARKARCIDIENGAALVSDAVPFVVERRLFLRETYGPDIGDDATCYVNRSNWEAVIEAFTQTRVPEPRWWVATLDGTQIIPNAPRSTWAVQYSGGPTAAYDISVLWGRDDLHHPGRS